MKEILVTQYMAEDGTVFCTEKKCLTYEEKFELRKALRKIKELCANMDCQFCPFSDNCGNCRFPSCHHTPDDWNIPED